MPVVTRPFQDAELPDVHAALHDFQNLLYQRPNGEEALGRMLLQNEEPQIPSSAANDMTGIGRSALKSLLSIRNSADEMAVANKQAQSIARASKIAAIRAYEALRSYDHLTYKEAQIKQTRKQCKEDPGCMMKFMTQQIQDSENTDHVPPGSNHRLNINKVPEPDARKAVLPELPPTSMLQLLPTSFLELSAIQRRAKASSFLGSHPLALDPELDPKNPKPPSIKMPGVPEEDDFNVDELVYLKQYMEQAFANLKRASIDAETMANSIDKKYHEVQNAAFAFQKALNYPGAPPAPTVAPVVIQPPKRPRDLSPMWLDVPYAISSGGDPYAKHDGVARDSMNEGKMLIPGFNPFDGSVPFYETGLKEFYVNVGKKAPVLGDAEYRQMPVKQRPTGWDPLTKQFIEGSKRTKVDDSYFPSPAFPGSLPAKPPNPALKEQAAIVDGERHWGLPSGIDLEAGGGAMGDQAAEMQEDAEKASGSMMNAF